MSQTVSATTRTDIDVQLGDTFALSFPILDSSTPPLTIDVTGWTAHAQVRHTAGDGLLYEWHTTPITGQGIATVSPAGVTLAFDGTVTAAWTWRRDAAFDLFVYEPTTAVPHCVAAGRFRVIPSITVGA